LTKKEIGPVTRNVKETKKIAFILGRFFTYGFSNFLEVKQLTTYQNLPRLLTDFFAQKYRKSTVCSLLARVSDLARYYE
jgi:hypothetical protein